MRFLPFFFLFALPALAAPPKAAFDAAQPITAFLAKPETAFSWRETARGEKNGPVSLEMTSQTWRGHVWKHHLTIFRPAKLEFPHAALISIQTRPTAFDGLLGQIAANRTGALFVSLYDVPNQPLWGKTEDELLAFSLEKAFETKDLSWPLVFPMAKSVTAAMSALSGWSDTQKGAKIEKFILVGASKRGWAAWLAASDKRVAGLVSIGYNNLNVEKQIPNQKAQWGELSPLLQAYTKRGLFQKMQTPSGKNIMAAVDPWALRNQITAPKFVIDSTNNGFWTLDAFDQYADGLKGQTSFLMLPNAGHYMENSMPQLFGSIGAWSRRVLTKEAWPDDIPIQISNLPDHKVRLLAGVTTFAKPENQAQTLRFWFAFSPSADFREAKWEQMEQKGFLAGNARTWSKIDLPISADKPFIAAFAEAEFADSPQPLRLTSRVLMWDSRAIQKQISKK